MILPSCHISNVIARMPHSATLKLFGDDGTTTITNQALTISDTVIDQNSVKVGDLNLASEAEGIVFRDSGEKVMAIESHQGVSTLAAVAKPYYAHVQANVLTPAELAAMNVALKTAGEEGYPGAVAGNPGAEWTGGMQGEHFPYVIHKKDDGTFEVLVCDLLFLTQSLFAKYEEKVFAEIAPGLAALQGGTDPAAAMVAAGMSQLKADSWAPALAIFFNLATQNGALMKARGIVSAGLKSDFKTAFVSTTRCFMHCLETDDDAVINSIEKLVESKPPSEQYMVIRRAYKAPAEDGSDPGYAKGVFLYECGGDDLTPWPYWPGPAPKIFAKADISTLQTVQSLQDYANPTP